MKDLGVLLSAACLALACAGPEGGEVGEAETGSVASATASDSVAPVGAMQPDAPGVADTVAREQADDTDPGVRQQSAASGSQESAQARADTEVDDTVAAEPDTQGGEQSSAGNQLDAAAVLRAASARYATITSLQAEFEMVTENRLLRSRTPSAGTLYQRRPDRIKLDFSDPAGDVVVSDGQWIWAYYPSADAAQAMRVPAGRGTGGAVDLQAQFVGDPVTRFTWEDGGREDVAGRPARVLTLTPREELSYARLKVWIDVEDTLVRRFEVTEHNGTVRHMELRQIRLNPTLDDEIFRFTPPPGVRVVDGG